MKSPNKKQAARVYVYAGGVMLALAGAIYASVHLSQQAAVVSLVAQLGYLAVLGLAIISGLNPILPVPAATLAPVFLAAELNLAVIIIALTIGTTIADVFG